MHQTPFEKLTGLDLVKKLHEFYGTWRFITAFTSALHLSLSWAKAIQSMPLHFTSGRCILTLFSHLRLVFQVVSFHRAFPPKPYIHLSCKYATNITVLIGKTYSIYFKINMTYSIVLYLFLQNWWYKSRHGSIRKSQFVGPMFVRKGSRVRELWPEPNASKLLATADQCLFSTVPQVRISVMTPAIHTDFFVVFLSLSRNRRNNISIRLRPVIPNSFLPIVPVILPPLCSLRYW